VRRAAERRGAHQTPWGPRPESSRFHVRTQHGATAAMDWSHAPRLTYIIIISASRQRARKTQSREIFFKPFAAGQTRSDPAGRKA
jgi:hypothetical protein